MPTPLVRISYKNVSGSVIPPYGVIQLTGAPIVTASGDYVFQATTPGSGNGPCMIDAGNGSAASGDGVWGSCIRGAEGPVWASYGGAFTTPTAWMPMGPVHGQTYVNETGGGWIYCGKYDSANSRVMIIRNPHPIWCKTATNISVGDPSSPTQFTVNVWLKSGVSWPYTQAVATDTPLLGLTVVNRNPGLSTTSTGKLGLIGWSDELLEYFPAWIDC